MTKTSMQAGLAERAFMPKGLGELVRGRERDWRMLCAKGPSLSMGLHARELAIGPYGKRAAAVLGPSVACASLFGPVVAGFVGWAKVGLGTGPKLGLGLRSNKR